MDILHHIAIQVPNIKEAVDYYSKNFNSKVVYIDDSWAFIEFANIYMALVLPEQHPFHIAFERDDAEKFGKLTKHRDGTESIYIKDPFGNNLEIIKDKNKFYKKYDKKPYT